ncbi:MAG: rhomboid family intramembrane serine protease [Armatimonadetes bacterium RBG_16_67_12]|nr:MAG: rhomboid family intramembrane serine protease [Armatimonadetes bacterium RBG_16_67_12]
MLPLRDHLPGRTTPVIVFLLILVNVLVFLYEVSLPEARLEAFIEGFGMIPYEITQNRDIPPRGPRPLHVTLFTSMFMHGGWLHLGGNMLYLWVFGNNVEDAFGHVGFLVFYLVVGLAGSLGQIIAGPASQIPAIGASGAIAGVLGAYIIFFPRARIDTLVYNRVVPLPALYVLGFWILLQFLQGIIALSPEAAQAGGVAWWAHIGGFVAGAAIGVVFRGRAVGLDRPSQTRY